MRSGRFARPYIGGIGLVLMALLLIPETVMAQDGTVQLVPVSEPGVSGTAR